MSRVDEIKEKIGYRQSSFLSDDVCKNCRNVRLKREGDVVLGLDCQQYGLYVSTWGYCRHFEKTQ